MFKDRLRAVAIARGYSLHEIADLAGVGIRTYQKYESGDAFPDIARLVSIADKLDVSLDWLMCRDKFIQSHAIPVEAFQEGLRRRPKGSKGRPLRNTLIADNA